VVAVLIAAEIGFRLGLWLQRRDPEAKSPVSGTVVGGMLGLMAFLLAFSIGIVINQHNGRKAMIVTEANAVGTAYLRAGFLDDPDRTSTRDLLREYVEVRLAAAADPARLIEATTARSEEIHAELWSIVEDNVRQGRESDIMSLFVSSINDVIDVHSLRLAAIDLRLPRLLGIVTYAATLLSFLLVGVANSADKKRDFLAILLFALAYVAVLILLVDLDRPQQGLIRVSQTALSDLLRQMGAPAP
jgi:hypothetical protein